jgi:hypothetical protein
LQNRADPADLKTHAMHRKSIDREIEGEQTNNKIRPKIQLFSIGYFTSGNLTGLKGYDNKNRAVDYVLCSKPRGIKNRKLSTQESNTPLHLKHVDKAVNETRDR